MLESRFTQPEGWQWRDKLETRPGQYIRIGWTIPDNAKALVVLLPGLSEYCEKYFEIVRNLTDRGFAVACIDWRGQGLSWRQGDRAKRYHDDFALDIEDARIFNESIPVPADMPRIMLAHSMGAHIGLRYLHDYPGQFHCAVLTAPMQGINLPGHIDPVLRVVVQIAAKLGLRESYLPGGKDWTETTFHNNIQLLTSDPARRNMQFYWMSTHPQLRMGGLTFSWLEQALKSSKYARNKKWLAEIETPCLIVQSEQEKIVSNRAIEHTARALKRTELLKLDRALHEAMMEQDVYRNQFWAAFDAFIAKHL